MSQSNPADINLNLTAVTEQLIPRKPSFIRGLTREELTAARLEGRNPTWKDEDILAYMNKPLSWLLEIREHPDYQDEVSKLRESGRKKRLNTGDSVSPGDIEDLFDAEIENSLEVIIGIRDNPGETASNRMKAAQMILERAPKVPSNKREEQAPKIILNIPYQQVETLKKVSDEMGRSDLIELLEGEDYTHKESGV